jgi:hypothetical protein
MNTQIVCDAAGRAIGCFMNIQIVCDAAGRGIGCFMITLYAMLQAEELAVS